MTEQGLSPRMSNRETADLIQCADQDDEIDLATLVLTIVEAIKERRGLAIIIFLATISFALAFAFLSPPIYRAEVVFSIISSEGQGSSASGALAFAGISLDRGGNSEQNAAFAALTSHAIIDSFIEKNNLLPIIFSKNWDNERQAWKSDKKPTQGEAYRAFKTGIYNVTKDTKTGIITLTIDWTDPQLAATWANDFIQYADSYMRQEAIENVKRGLVFLEAELNKTTAVEVQKSILQLMESQIKKNMVANTASRYVYKIIDPATVPDRKVRPKRLLILIMAGLAGTMLTIFVPLILQQWGKFRERMKSIKQFAESSKAHLR